MSEPIPARAHRGSSWKVPLYNLSSFEPPQRLTERIDDANASPAADANVSPAVRAWRYPLPISRGDSWYQILNDFASQLVDLEPPEANLHANQVKEIFGGLRFYTRSVLSAISQQRIEEAEARSFTICEACGAPGALQHRGEWYRTRCPHHAALDDV